MKTSSRLFSSLHFNTPVIFSFGICFLNPLAYPQWDEAGRLNAIVVRIGDHSSIRRVEIFACIYQYRSLMCAFLPDSIPEIPSDNGHIHFFQTVQKKFLSIPILFAQPLA